MGMNTDAVQRLYVAYFNRPADPVSLAVYESLLPSDRVATQAELQAIADKYFSPSAEYQTMYAGKSNTQIVDQLYQNIFGRSAEVDGLVYWAAELTAGRQTVASIALQLSYSAQGTDADVVSNRIEAAKAFTDSLDTAEEITGYSGDAAAASARAWLQTVGSSEASKDAAIAGVDTAVSDAVAAGNAIAGQSFALTTGVDTFTGGGGDDTFAAANGTLNLLDKVDGGAGTDTFNIVDSSNTAFALDTVGYTITGIETITLAHSSNAAGDSVTFDASTLADLDTVTITNTGTASPVTVTGKGNIQSLTVSGGAGADITTATISDSGTATTDALTTVSLTGLTGTAGITADSVTTLNLNSVAGLTTITDSSAADARTLTVNANAGTLGGVTDAGAKTLQFNVKGSAVLGTVTTAAATTVNIDVDSAMTSGTFSAAAATDVNIDAGAKITAITVTAGVAKTIDISGAGAISLTHTAAANAVITSTGSGAVTMVNAIAAGQKYVGGSGVDTVTFAATGTTASSLGDGNDVATFSAVAGTGGSVDAGAGDADTVVLTAANAVTLSGAATFEADIANFERVQIGAYTDLNTGNGNTINLANLDDINYVISGGSAAQTQAEALIISNASSGGTYDQRALLNTNANQSITGNFSGAADVFNVKMQATDGFANVGSLTLAAIETVNITTNDTDTTAPTTVFDPNMDANNATTITISGDVGLTLANSSATALRTLDATGVTKTGAAGGVTFTAATAAQDVTLKGGAGRDALIGNSGNDTIEGNGDNDTLGGVAGNDTIDGGAGVDTITGGTGTDVMTGGSGTDIFVFADNDSTTAATDEITDYAKDVIRLAAADNVAGESANNNTAAGTDVYVSAGGKVTFNAADDTLAEKLTALAADTTDIAANEVVFFEHAGDTYIFNNVGGTDDLIKLTGVTGYTTLTESTTTAGDFSLSGGTGP